MDYIQNQLLERIRLTKDRVDGQAADIAGYYDSLMQYRLSLMFACVWDKREPELSRTNPKKRMDYLTKMQKASLGTILTVIMELDREGTPILGVDQKFEAQVISFIKLRNAETAHTHGVLLPGVQEDSYRELADTYERIYMSIQKMQIPILSEDYRIYYMPDDIISTHAIVFGKEGYGYQDLTEELVRKLGLQAGELYYFNDVCYKISPFLVLKENDSGKDPYEIFCYQGYNLRNGMFEYKKYFDLNDNVSYRKCNSDYFQVLQEEL